MSASKIGEGYLIKAIPIWYEMGYQYLKYCGYWW
jgi:hypothetical protein